MSSILHITPSYIPAYIYGGPTISVSALCEGLAKSGNHIEVLTTTANGKDELPVIPATVTEVNGVQVSYFTRYTKDHTHFSPGLLLQVWKNCRKFDAVHIHSWWNTVVICSVFICWLRGVRPVLSPRGMLSPYTLQSARKRFFHNVIGKWLLRKTILHATTKQEAEEYKAVCSDCKSHTLPNFVKLPEFRPARVRSDTDSFKVLFLSRIDPKKGLELLLEALKDVDFPYKLSIAGTGKERYVEQLRQLISDLNIGNQVEWLGHINGDLKFELLENADLLALTSYNENFANVVVESLSVGTPVLISDKVGLSDYVLENNLGWVSQLNTEAIRKAFKSSKENMEMRKKINSWAPGKVKQDFASVHLIEQYMDLYLKNNLKSLLSDTMCHSYRVLINRIFPFLQSFHSYGVSLVAIPQGWYVCRKIRSAKMEPRRGDLIS